jgi:cytoskeleton protein RodZ
MNIGAELLRAREARGLSIDALAATTRIQPRVIEGIERNDLSVIPPRPYARGFVAAYAREVGLNADQTVRDYFAQFAVPGVASEQAAVRPPNAAPPARRPAMALAAIGMLAVAAIVMMWRSEAVVPPIAGAVGTTGTVAPPSSAVAGVSDPAPVPGVARATSPVEEHIVAVLEAERAAWIAAIADGQRVLYRLVPPGTTETLRARREISIRVGDAGAVRLSINGGPPAPMGQNGQVRDVTLTQSALR